MKKVKITFYESLKRKFRFALWFSLFTTLSVALLFIIGYNNASKNISFLPEIPETDFNSHISEINQIKLKNPWYDLFVNKYGRVSIKSKEGEIIMSNLSFFAAYDGLKDSWGLDNITVKLANDSTISISGEGPLGTCVRILLIVYKDISKIDVNVQTHYSNKTIIHREALVAQFNVNVSEVYLRNRKLDEKSIDLEYWLQQQGARFGSGLNSALIYHTPFVSSLQLDTKRNLLFVNLEYNLDHPFIHFPYQEDGGGKWENLSMAKYNAGDERSNNFSVYIGNIPKAIPRIMMVPYGYLAGFVFTEHADGGTIRTNRAAYFGSESILKAEDATGGFVGHKIPVTKSVFYSDPDGPPETSIQDDPEKPQFLEFLDHLYNTGNYDICLHTPDGSNSNREILEESINFMKNRFGTKVWIDHGINSGKINRESFACDGLNPDSRYYAADLWEKYDTRYFWSPAVEEISKFSIKENLMKIRLFDVSKNIWRRHMSPKELHDMNFHNALTEMVRRYSEKVELNSLLPYQGNAFPTPLYWQNLTQTKKFYSWVTNDIRNVNNLSEKKVLIEQKLLKKLISDWGVNINHGYFVDNLYHKYVILDSNGKYIVNPYFDKILAHMAQMRDDGNLYITTIRDLLDYWILLERITFDYLPDGAIIVTNGNDQSIKGLSLVVHANTVRINGETPKFRLEDDNTIFWFDIPARHSMKIQVE